MWILNLADGISIPITAIADWHLSEWTTSVLHPAVPTGIEEALIQSGTWQFCLVDIFRSCFEQERGEGWEERAGWDRKWWQRRKSFLGHHLCGWGAQVDVPQYHDTRSHPQAAWTLGVAFVPHKDNTKEKRGAEETWREQRASKSHHDYKQDWLEQAAENCLPGGPWSLAFFTVKRKKKKRGC